MTMPHQNVGPPPGGYAPPGGAPSPQKPRPGRAMPIIALVSAVVGFLVVCVGFLAFLPEVGRVLGYSSFAGWVFLIAGLVLAIVSLVKRATGIGMSIAALVVSIAGAVIGFIAGVVVGVAGFIGYTVTIIDEYGDLVPTPPAEEWSTPDGSLDADVQADCDAVLAADPGASVDEQGVGELLTDLTDEMTTDEVRVPLGELAEAYTDFQDIDGPHDLSEASGEIARAASDLAAVCGFTPDDLP